MKSNEIAERLLAMQEKVEEARSSLDSLRGAIRQIKEQLEAEFKVDSFKKAAKLLAKYNEEISEIEEQLMKGVKELEKQGI